MKTICSATVLFLNGSGFIQLVRDGKIIDLETGNIDITTSDLMMANSFNSISVAAEGMNKAYPVVKKYGGYYICAKGLDAIRRHYIENAEKLKERYINPRYFFDMDGCLAEWKAESSFEKLYEQGYFLRLKPIEKTIQFAKNAVKEGIDCYIVTAYLTDSKYAKTEKMAWLKKYLPEIPEENWIFVRYGDDKSKYIKGGISEKDILFDDHTPNCIQWEEAGGKAKKVLNGVNSLKKTWTGDTFDATK